MKYLNLIIILLSNTLVVVSRAAHSELQRPHTFRHKLVEEAITNTRRHKLVEEAIKNTQNLIEQNRHNLYVLNQRVETQTNLELKALTSCREWQFRSYYLKNVQNKKMVQLQQINTAILELSEYVLTSLTLQSRNTGQRFYGNSVENIQEDVIPSMMQGIKEMYSKNKENLEIRVWLAVQETTILVLNQYLGLCIGNGLSGLTI